jgi:hypothetical protein
MTTLKKTFVYEFLYSSDCESGVTTISIHKTKKGAKKAMELHKENIKKQWEEECKQYPEAKEYPYDYDQFWAVNPCELLP